MPTRTFFNIEVESEVGAEAVLRMIDWLKTQPGLIVKETMTWVAVVAAIPPAVPLIPQWKVAAPLWNVRSRPSMLDNVEILGQLKQGEVVGQLEENADWVKHNGAGDPKRDRKSVGE